MVEREYVPISVAYRRKYGKKVTVKEFTNIRCVDRLLSTRSKLLPKDCEVLDIGWGKRFYQKYKNKYK